MQDIYNILIQNGIPPTWVDEKAKQRFSQWVEDLNDHNTASFSGFLEKAKQQTDVLSKELDKISATCQETIKSATSALDRILCAPAHNHSTRYSHLQMLESWIPLHGACPSFLNALATIESENNRTLLAQPYIMEMTLRCIALKVTGKESLLLSNYRHYTENSLAGEVIAEKINRLRALVIKLEELLSSGINNASNVITAVNKNLSAPTEYTNLLHRLMVELHDIEKNF